MNDPSERTGSARPRVGAVRLARLPDLLLRAAGTGHPTTRDVVWSLRCRRRLPAAVLHGVPARAARGCSPSPGRSTASAWPSCRSTRRAPASSSTPTAFLGFAGPPRAAVGWLALMLVGDDGAGAGGSAAPGYGLAAGAGDRRGVVGATNIHFAEMRRKDGRLRVAQEAVVEMARIAERERIGRDLHDLLGHTLSVIVLKSELAAKLADRDPARAAERDPRRRAHLARRARRSAQGGARLSRRAGCATRSPTPSACSSRPASPPRSTSIPATLPPDEERALAFALREAVTNVVRHAGATRCWIGLREDGGRHVASRCATTAAAAWRRKAAACRACASACARWPARSSAAASAARACVDVAAARTATLGVIRVLIAEDQAMVLGALRRCSRSRPTSRWWRRADGHRGAASWRRRSGPTSWSPTSRCPG